MTGPVRCALVRRTATIGTLVGAAAGVAVLTLAGCGSGDSTASKTPGPTAVSTPSSSAPPPPPSATDTPGASAPPVPNDPCATNLTAPEIAKAVSELPADPRSEQGWNPEPIAGNYNECAQLSAVIIKANTNSENPNTRALLFHRGKFIPTGVPDTYGFNGLDTVATTGDTVALEYSSGVPGLDSVVKFRWNGSGVELIGNTGG
ncbi:MAG: LppP/LprE family lipoprotein [Mycobacterium sp.]|nr:LppP/LprE family lipoprotein [Mycobacterium sp.]